VGPVSIKRAASLSRENGVTAFLCGSPAKLLASFPNGTQFEEQRYYSIAFNLSNNMQRITSPQQVATMVSHEFGFEGKLNCCFSIHFIISHQANFFRGV